MNIKEPCCVANVWAAWACPAATFLDDGGSCEPFKRFGRA